jgi:hypothetical protein
MGKIELAGLIGFLFGISLGGFITAFAMSVIFLL